MLPTITCNYGGCWWSLTSTSGTILEHWDEKHGVYWFLNKVEPPPKSVATILHDIREAATKYHAEERRDG